MNPYRKTVLYAALAAAGTLVTGAGLAVNLSSDNRGEVLLYPYYTTRADGAGNAYATLLSVVNGTAQAKAVKVKFLEGKNGRDVRNFNLFLSPFDVWTAAILPDTMTGGAKVGTIDRSCTMPAFSASPTAPYFNFINMTYSGPSDDEAGTSLDRTREGHFEIIEMATYAATSNTGKAITHVNGVPPCGNQLTDSQALIDAQVPTGGLFGSATLINVNSGTDYSEDAVALADFYQIGPNYNATGTTLPDLTQASPPVSAVFTPAGLLYESIWSAGTADAVSAVLMRESLMNEYVLDTATKSGTDWVITMPTKSYYTSDGTGNAAKLFQRRFNGMSGSCDDVRLTIWDREERNPSGTIPTITLCWAANVITFNQTNVLGSTNRINVQPTFQNGWATATFLTGIAGAAPNVHKLISTQATQVSGGGQTIVGVTRTYVGLPAIGFAVASFANGTLQVGSPPVNVLSNYGGNFAHKTNTLIQ